MTGIKLVFNTIVFIFALISAHAIAAENKNDLQEASSDKDQTSAVEQKQLNRQSPYDMALHIMNLQLAGDAKGISDLINYSARKDLSEPESMQLIQEQIDELKNKLGERISRVDRLRPLQIWGFCINSGDHCTVKIALEQLKIAKKSHGTFSVHLLNQDGILEPYPDYRKKQKANRK